MRQEDIDKLIDKLATTEPGHFARYGDCSLWFEIGRVYTNDKIKPSVVMASRDPGKTTMCFVGNYFSALSDVKPSVDKYDRVVYLDGSRNYFDKFYPMAKIVN